MYVSDAGFSDFLDVCEEEMSRRFWFGTHCNYTAGFISEVAQLSLDPHFGIKISAVES